MSTDLDQLFASLRTDADVLRLDPPQAARKRGANRRRAQFAGTVIAIVALACGGYTVAAGGTRGLSMPGSTATHPAPGRTPPATGVLNDVAFSPDGKFLATANDDGTAQLWTVPALDRIKTFRGTASRAFSVAFSPDGTTIAVADSSNTTRLWNVTTGAATATFTAPPGSFVPKVAFSPDGKTLAVTGDGTVRLWDIATRHVNAVIGAANVVIEQVAFNRAGTLLVTAGAHLDDSPGNNQPTVAVWTVATGRPATTIPGFVHVSGILALAPDGTTVAAQDSVDGTVRLWNAATGAAGHVLPGSSADFVLSMAYSPDGTYLAVGYADHTTKLWNAATGTLVVTITGHTAEVEGVAFSPDGRTLATASADATVELTAVPAL